MRICLLHLSDLHFRTTKNLLAFRPPAIANAVRAIDPGCTHYLVLISGDIAFSGKAEEYSVALSFFDELKSQLRTLKVEPAVHWAAIPGNHDCDFDRHTDTRRMAAEYLKSRMQTFDAQGSIAESCLAVQEEFFDFEARLVSSTKRPVEERFLWQSVWNIDCYNIAVCCINSAWLSQLPEKQGDLLFPITTIQRLQLPNRCAFAVTIMHHPYNWFPTDMARELQTTLESSADIILTGHEHFPDTFTRELFSGERIRYCPGGVLQDTEEKLPSSFNVVVVDLLNHLFRVHRLRWASGMYSEAEVASTWNSLPRMKGVGASQFSNCRAYEKYLNDLGTGFTHSSKKEIQLRDLYVDPELHRRMIGTQKDRSDSNSSGVSGSGTVSASTIVGELGSGEILMILGDPLSGKSTLCKSFYEDLRKRELVPLLVSGKDFAAASGDHLNGTLKRAFEEQYSTGGWPAFTQMQAQHKALIIDDFHICTLETSAKNQLMMELSARFDRVVIFADDLAGIEMLSEGSELAGVIGLSIYNIREFGNLLRARLIDRWVALDSVFTLTETAKERQANVLERLVRTVLGKNLLPSFPVVVLTILQAWESSKDQNFAGGSYGYLYETLILRALSLLNLQPTEIDIVKTYLALIANAMREEDAKYLSFGRYDELRGRYYDRFKVPVPGNIVESLKSARILKDGSGGLGFQYPYYYFFFAALYFRDKMGKEAERASVRQTLEEMTESIHYEDYAQILLFFVYLTKDIDTIEKILNCAKRIFDDYSPCDLAKDIEFANKLFTTSPKLVLESIDHRRNREEYKMSLDEHETSPESAIPEKSFNLRRLNGMKSWDKDLSDTIRLNVATKMLQILGQVLRTSPGSLEADIKQEVATEAYLLGLRTLNAVLRMSSDNIESLRVFLAELIKEQRALKKQSIQPNEIARLADEGVIRIAEMSIVGMVRRISQSVGTEYLEEIYAGVLKSRPESIPFRLIDLSVRLDLMKDPPMEDIEDLDEDLGKSNFVARGVLRDLIYLYLYLNPVNYRTRQRLTSMMQISTNNKLIDNPSKKRR